MKLKEFSVTNYRSITSAHKIVMQNLTVLVGKNNEGKSNLLTALNVAMTAILLYSRKVESQSLSRRGYHVYDWERDFPVQYQARRNGLESIFKLIFTLDENELSIFHSETGTRGNEDIPITVKIGRDGVPKIEVPKRGSSSYQTKSRQVTEFIAKRISFNYIQAIRTDQMAISALQRVISNELVSLKENPEYVNAQQTVSRLEEEVLNQMSEQLKSPLSVFLPNLRSVALKRVGDDYRNNLFPFYRNDIDVIIDDGIPTSISNKGDGIKSLVTLAILKDQKITEGASIIAIEEPESHLHSGAIHSLVDVITKMAENSQVIITTHNPLFVQQNRLSSNILVDQGTARAAKNIGEIRNILGVLPSDNLRNARFVLVVEGEDDKIALAKLLPVYSESVKTALASNLVVIKPLYGASNLSHDLADLKNSMCRYVVLLDYDDAGKNASDKAKAAGLLKDSEVKFTICNGMPQAEFEDCLKPSIYEQVIQEEFGVSLKDPNFKGNKKWSDRIRDVFLSQGSEWSDRIEKRVKDCVARAIPDRISRSDINNVVIKQKAGFLQGVATSIERLIQE